MKKVCCTIPLLAILIGLLWPVSIQAATANSNRVLTIIAPDGQKLDGGTVFIPKQRLAIPLRQLAEATHANLSVSNNSNTVTFARWPGEVYTLKVNATDYILNDTSRMWNTRNAETVWKKNGQLYVPMSFVEELGYSYHYDNDTLTMQSPINTSLKQVLYQGDLAAARELITSGRLPIPIPGSQSLRKPLDVQSDGERLDQEFLFPEGEALRFYHIYGDTISLIEFKNDFPVITWQAHGLSAATGDFHIVNDLLTFQLKDKWGNIPLKYTNFAYYLRGGWGDSYLQVSAIIKANNIYHQTGRIYKVGGSVSDQSGTISYVLPDEKRIDTRSY